MKVRSPGRRKQDRLKSRAPKKTDAWFVGFAPADKPRVAFVLWVEEDGTGGNMAKSIGVTSLVGHALAVTKTDDK